MTRLKICHFSRQLDDVFKKLLKLWKLGGREAIMTDTKCQVVDVVKTLFVTKSDDLVKAKRSLLIPTWKVRDQFGNHQDEEKLYMLEKRKNCRKFESWRKKNKVYIHQKWKLEKLEKKRRIWLSGLLNTVWKCLLSHLKD